MKAENRIGISILIFLLLVSSVASIHSGDVTLTTPTDNTWTNLTNYTTGFIYEWSDNEFSYNSTCNLYLGTTNNFNVIKNTAGSLYGETSNVAQATATTQYMNQTFSANNTRFYWTVECCNSTATPNMDCWAPSLRVLDQDVTTLDLTVVGTSFTNNTWITTSTVDIELTPVGSTSLQGDQYTCNVLNFTNNAIFASEDTDNNTPINVTWTADDGQYNITGSCNDPAGSSNISSARYIVKVDTTTPVISYNSPADEVVSTVNYLNLNFSLTELNVDTISLNYSGTTSTIAIGNCTGTAPNYVCVYNKSGLSAAKDLSYYIFVNDSAGNTGTGSTRTASIDLASPVITTAYNWTASDSVSTYKLLVTDTTPTTCVGTVYQKSGASVGTITGSWIYGTTTSNCTGTFTGSDDITVEGNFRISWDVTDSASNTVQANQTGVYKILYAGWNVITWSDAASTSLNVCETIDGCSQVSWYNNSAASFVTYSTSTPSVNNGTTISAGDGILVYVSAQADYVTNDYLPNDGDSTVFSVMYDRGWQLFGITEDANISAVYNAITNGTASDKNITWASEYDANAESFKTCNRANGICTGATSDATDIDLPLGSAAWILTDQNANYTINRTKVTG